MVKVFNNITNQFFDFSLYYIYSDEMINKDNTNWFVEFVESSSVIEAGDITAFNTANISIINAFKGYMYIIDIVFYVLKTNTDKYNKVLLDKLFGVELIEDVKPILLQEKMNKASMEDLDTQLNDVKISDLEKTMNHIDRIYGRLKKKYMKVEKFVKEKDSGIGYLERLINIIQINNEYNVLYTFDEIIGKILSYNKTTVDNVDRDSDINFKIDDSVINDLKEIIDKLGGGNSGGSKRTHKKIRRRTNQKVRRTNQKVRRTNQKVRRRTNGKVRRRTNQKVRRTNKKKSKPR